MSRLNNPEADDGVGQSQKEVHVPGMWPGTQATQVIRGPSRPHRQESHPNNRETGSRNHRVSAERGTLYQALPSVTCQ